MADAYIRLDSEVVRRQAEINRLRPVVDAAIVMRELWRHHLKDGQAPAAGAYAEARDHLIDKVRAYLEGE